MYHYQISINSFVGLGQAKVYMLKWAVIVHRDNICTYYINNDFFKETNKFQSFGDIFEAHICGSGIRICMYNFAKICIE